MIQQDDTVYVYNATTGEYFSLGSGWTSEEEAIEYAETEGYINIETQNGVLGTEETQL